jgi:hypothetical protein
MLLFDQQQPHAPHGFLDVLWSEICCEKNRQELAPTALRCPPHIGKAVLG